MTERFRQVSDAITRAVGSFQALLLAIAVIATWALTGPLFRFSDTWQLVINTGTTIVTFLMVFVIQNTQNRDSKAVHLKLDEIIRANKRARNRVISTETATDAEVADLEREMAAAATAKHRSPRRPTKEGDGEGT